MVSISMEEISMSNSLANQLAEATTNKVVKQESQTLSFVEMLGSIRKSMQLENFSKRQEQ